MKPLRLLALVSLLAATSAAAALRPAELADRAAVIEYAAHTGDLKYLVTLSERLANETARGDAQKLVHYYAALAAYRAAEIDADIEFRVGVLLDRCIEQGKLALKIDREYAEALALVGACHGLSAARQPLAAIVAGNFSARELKRAVKLAPENPRVRLLQGITLMRRYDDAGRRQQARDNLTAALAAYERFGDFEHPYRPGWGEEHAHFWLARLSVIEGDRVAARDHLERALLIAPQFEAAAEAFRQLGS